MSVDPVTFMDTGNPGMFNRYSYTMNDPINFNDPTGMIREGSGWADGEFEEYKNVSTEAYASGKATADNLNSLAEALESGEGLDTPNNLEMADRFTEAFGNDALNAKNVSRTADAFSKAADKISPDSTTIVNRSDVSSEGATVRGDWNGSSITIYDSGSSSASILLHEGGHAAGGRHFSSTSRPTVGPLYRSRARTSYNRGGKYSLRYRRQFKDPGFFSAIE